MKLLFLSLSLSLSLSLVHILLMIDSIFNNMFFLIGFTINLLTHCAIVIIAVMFPYYKTPHFAIVCYRWGDFAYIVSNIHVHIGSASTT